MTCLDESQLVHRIVHSSMKKICIAQIEKMRMEFDSVSAVTANPETYNLLPVVVDMRI
jgi:hypothetical protein